MSEPTRLTAEDLPTLRKLAGIFGESERRNLGSLDGALFRALAEIFRLYVEVIERTGHFASDERVDKDGRVGRL